MKRDKEWFKKQHRDVWSDFYSNLEGMGKLRDRIEGLIEQLDEPEKVVIPKYMDDFIYYVRNDVGNLAIAIYEIYERNEPRDVIEWLSQDDNDEILMKAFAGDWEIEEPMYYAKIKGHEFINTGIILDDDTGEDVSEWNRHIYFIQQMDGNVVIDMKDSGLNGAKHFMTIKEWAKLGINEINADFEPVEVAECI